MRAERGLSWAGLIGGPGAWAISTQGNYALAIPQCLSGVAPIPWLSLILAFIALGSAGLSGIAWRHGLAEPEGGPRKPRTELFFAMIGVALGVLFAAVILLQAYAGLVFTGCER